MSFASPKFLIQNNEEIAASQRRETNRDQSEDIDDCNCSRESESDLRIMAALCREKALCYPSSSCRKCQKLKLRLTQFDR